MFCSRKMYEIFIMSKSEGKKMKLKTKKNILDIICVETFFFFLGLDMTYYLFGIVNLAKMHGLHSYISLRSPSFFVLYRFVFFLCIFRANDLIMCQLSIVHFLN